jgi:UDP-3-O-[3-hydroxymyristoyl] glucosamine N-acyltransferase
MKQVSAAEIANLTGGIVLGQTDVQISRVDKLEEAGPLSLSFFSNPKYQDRFFQTSAGIVLIPSDFQTDKQFPCTVIKTPNPYYAFCQVLDRYFNPNQHKTGREEHTYVSDTASIGEEVYLGFGSYVDEGASVANGVKIYPQVYIGRNVRIGTGTILYPGVKVYSDCTIGAHCIIHSGTVIGSDGFGFAPIGDGSYAKIPQIGNVVIEDLVEIGSNCSIDRATMGSTIIRKGVKLDNLIQVAHNAEIGEHTVIAAQTGVSGSTRIGKRCMIGGQVGFVGHINVADGTQIGAQSGIQKEISEPGQQWIGSPVMPLKEAFRTQVIMRKLPDLQQRIIELEKRIQELTKS